MPLLSTQLRERLPHRFTLCHLLLLVSLFQVALRANRICRCQRIVQEKRPQVCSLLFHHVECVAIEDAHEPGAERTAMLETWQPAPGQQKGSLRYFLRQCALVT